MTAEEKKEYRKRYREKNRERINELKRAAYYRYVENDPDFNAKRYARYIENHPNDAKERYQKLIEKNPEFCKEHYAKYKDAHRKKYKEEYSTIEGRCAALIRKYRAADRRKNIDPSNNIKKTELIGLIKNNKCIYCGDDDWRHLGADRIDNSKPHTPDNCICACGVCNVERNNNMSVEEFIEYRKIHPRQLGGNIEKSWEIVEQNGVRVIKKKN